MCECEKKQRWIESVIKKNRLRFMDLQSLKISLSFTNGKPLQNTQAGHRWCAWPHLCLFYYFNWCYFCYACKICDCVEMQISHHTKWRRRSGLFFLNEIFAHHLIVAIGREMLTEWLIVSTIRPIQLNSTRFHIITILWHTRIVIIFGCCFPMLSIDPSRRYSIYNQTELTFLLYSPRTKSSTRLCLPLFFFSFDFG